LDRIPEPALVPRFAGTEQRDSNGVGYINHAL